MTDAEIDLKAFFEFVWANVSTPEAWVHAHAEREDNDRLIDTGELHDLPCVEVPWP